MNQNPSRLRQTPIIRNMLAEIKLSACELIAPIFVHSTIDKPQAIQSMPGIMQWPISHLNQEIDALIASGINSIILFGIPEYKDEVGSSSFDDNGIIQKAIKHIKHHYPDLLVIADVCFCEYTSHGHCGALDHNHIDTEETCKLLQKQALSLAKAGADWIAPSGMTDGMVASIRESLDTHGFSHISILSYSVKYASNLYGPFREAAEGAPQFGDRKSYQMDFRNRQEALLEAKLDIQQGADLIMVKPAGFYLDIIQKLKTSHPDVPLCAYQVSGEYSMIKNAIAANLLSFETILESLIAIKRAGADCIITYFAKEIAPYL